MSENNYESALSEVINGEWLKEEVAELGKHFNARGITPTGAALVMAKLLVPVVASLTIAPKEEPTE